MATPSAPASRDYFYVDISRLGGSTSYKLATYLNIPYDNNIHTVEELKNSILSYLNEKRKSSLTSRDIKLSFKTVSSLEELNDANLEKVAKLRYGVVVAESTYSPGVEEWDELSAPEEEDIFAHESKEEEGFEVIEEKKKEGEGENIAADDV